MTNRKLRKDLLDKLGITRQALYAQVKKIKKKHQMTTEDAIYVIAHNNEFLLDQYLDKTTLDRMRGIIQQISSKVQTSEERKSKQKGTSRGESQRVVEIAKEFTIQDPSLSNNKVNEAKEMAAVYPLLYILENSIREIIDRVMSSKHGKNWWESHAPIKLRKEVKKRMTEDKRNTWFQRRGDRPIDYTDLNQLKPLMRKIENAVVPDIFPNIEWIIQRIDDVYKSRCVVCHMNPLHKDNIASVKLIFRQWEKQIKGKNI